MKKFLSALAVASVLVLIGCGTPAGSGSGSLGSKKPDRKIETPGSKKEPDGKKKSDEAKPGGSGSGSASSGSGTGKPWKPGGGSSGSSTPGSGTGKPGGSGSGSAKPSIPTPQLKNTEWNRKGDSSYFHFSASGNTVTYSTSGNTYTGTYTVTGNTVSFDFKASAESRSKLTPQKLAQEKMKFYEEVQKKDPTHKDKYQDIIDELKKFLSKGSPLPEILKNEYELSIKAANEFAQYARFSGTLDTKQTTLTIPQLPVIGSGFTVTCEKAEFKKQ